MAVASWANGVIALSSPWPPNTEMGFLWEPGESWLQFTAVTVSMHALDVFETTAISIRETTVQDFAPSGRRLTWTAYNSSFATIRSVVVYLGVIGP